MKLVKHYLTKNPCYGAGKKMRVKGLMLHSVGCPQPDAQVFLKNWNCVNYDRACVHAFIDGNDGTIYQALPWDYRGWHCGGLGNDSYIGVEMCEPSCIRYTKGARFVCSDLESARKTAKCTYEASVELFAYLCKLYNLQSKEEGVILSHREAYVRGLASNHGDPLHLWNGLGMGYTMDGFRRDVAEKMQNSVLESSPVLIDVGNKDLEVQLLGSDLLEEEYLVQVSIPNLIIRKGPGTDFARMGDYTGVGVFTIVDEADGIGASRWGRLKSGAGWISLDYAKRVA